MVNNVSDDMYLFFVDKESETIFLMYHDTENAEEKAVCCYDCSFEEFVSMTELYTVPSVFFDMIMETQNHLTWYESENEYAKMLKQFYSDTHAFEGLNENTLKGILKTIKEYGKDIKPYEEDEYDFAYSQDKEVMINSGYIGHLRADFGSSGNEFYSTWWESDTNNKTVEFKEEFDKIINTLRFDEKYGGLLASRSKMSSYCYNHPQAQIDDWCKSSIFRLDTDKYSYMLRCNSMKGDYNLYCYCYIKDMLDKQLGKIKAPSLSKMIEKAEAQKQQQYYYKFDDVDKAKEEGLETEGYDCLNNVKLYTQEEYDQMPQEEKDGMWGVYFPNTYSHEFALFSNKKDAYAALKETQAQTDFEYEHDL